MARKKTVASEMIILPAEEQGAKAVKETKAAKAPRKNTKTEEWDAIIENDGDGRIKDLEAQIAALKEELKSRPSQPQIIVATPDNGERVHFLWQAEVAHDNTVEFGDGGMYGRIVGKTGSFYVPKNDLSRVLDSAARLYLDKRWLIIVSGLTEDEREALGVDYREGEILDKRAFAKLLEMDRDELVSIYRELCDSHKEMVAKRFYEAFKDGKAVSRETVVALNGVSPIEAFKAIISDMNEADLK